MNRHQIIRAWKDPEYRQSLSLAEREQLPSHPAGLIELSDDDLLAAAGGLPSPKTAHCTFACTIPYLGCD